MEYGELDDTTRKWMLEEFRIFTIYTKQTKISKNEIDYLWLNL